MGWSSRPSVVIFVLIVVVGVTVIRAGDESASTTSPVAEGASTTSPVAPNPTNPTYYDFYKEGRVAYTKERWFEAIDLLERALEDWRWYREELAQCRIKCRKLSDDMTLDKQITHFDLILAARWIINAACQKKCKREKFPNRAAVYDEKIDDEFVQLKPYNYLQMSYYKASRYVTTYQELINTKTHQTDYLKKAIQSAYTFLLRHPGDEAMRRNIDFYKSIPSSKDDMYVSLEEPQHQKYYKAAANAYDTEVPDFKAVKENILTAIDEYYKAFAVCEAHCEKPQTNDSSVTSNSILNEGFTEDLFINIADHMTSYVKCVAKCPDTLSMFFGQVLENYLPNHYHYLQFAAYKMDDTTNTAMGCATYLLFHPKDEDMQNNQKFFLEKLGIPAEKFTPHKEAVNHIKHLKEIERLRLFIETKYQRVRNTSNDFKPSVVIDPATHDKARPAMTPDQLVPISEEELSKLKKDFGFQLFADAKKLNGSHRVALDDVASPEECSRLVELASAGEGGDGYGRFKGSGNHPHTPHESFAGLTVGKAAELAEAGTIPWQDAWTFLDLAERSRVLTEKYFKLPSKLYFSFTHLVCRTAEATDAQKGREDLSHPIHSDNCNLLEDGTCIYSYPAFTWRDFSSILYLNEGFAGGNFLFADPDKSIKAELEAKPGRLVAFYNGIDNLHGVKAVTSGRRCALAMWYTMDPAEHEKGQENHVAARNILTTLKLNAEKGDSASADSAVPEITPDSLAESAVDSAPPPPISPPKDVDEIIASNDVDIADSDNGGYASIDVKHNEL